MLPPKKETAREQANRRLLACLARLSAAGEEWLPGERSLCDELGVSVTTVRSALKQLVQERLIESVPSKGNRICRPEKKHANVGIVLCHQMDVSFVASPHIMKGIFDVFTMRQNYLRIIELRDFERAPRVFNKLRLDACIVVKPERKLYPKIVEAMKRSRVPTLPILTEWSEDAEVFPCYVTADTRGSLRARAEFLARSGCKNVAHMNYSPSSNPCLKFSTFQKSFAKEGVQAKPEWILSEHEVVDKLPKLLNAGIIDCAIVHGGMENMRRVFEILDRHERGGDIVLLVDDIGAYLAEFHSKYPRVNVSGACSHPLYEMGLRAAQAIGDFLDDGQALGFIELPFTIQAPEWRSTASAVSGDRSLRKTRRNSPQKTEQQL